MVLMLRALMQDGKSTKRVDGSCEVHVTRRAAAPPLYVIVPPRSKRYEAAGSDSRLLLETASKGNAVMPPNEQTPLLTTVVITPPGQRYSHNYIRRFCTAALSITLLVVIILFLVPAHWLPGNHNEAEWSPFHFPSSYYPSRSWPMSSGLSYENLQQILLDTPEEDKAREWSKYYTAGPHLAGKNFSQAEWTRTKWEEFGIASSIVDYDVLLNYPVSNRLALLKKQKELTHQVLYECSMEEDVLEEDATSGLKDRIPTFHGYSASGNVTGQYVYVNFGTYWDFEDLVKANVSLEGKIALAKYGRVFRGLKVKRAQELGMIGVVMYSDPQEDGDITELRGYKPYPDGPARQPSSVQRGSTQFLCKITSDLAPRHTDWNSHSTRRSYNSWVSK